MERQYRSNGFGKFPGIKLTPGQVTQKGIVTMIMDEKSWKQIRRKYPQISGIALATVYAYVKKFRFRKGLTTPDPSKEL